jgi:hypothetical protein
MIPRPNDRIRLDAGVLDTLFHSPAVLAAGSPSSTSSAAAGC